METRLQVQNPVQLFSLKLAVCLACPPFALHCFDCVHIIYTCSDIIEEYITDSITFILCKLGELSLVAEAVMFSGRTRPEDDITYIELVYIHSCVCVCCVIN